MLIRKLFVTVVVICFTGSPLVSETHRISPDNYYITFSSAHRLLAHVRPSDTVITKCLDSRGLDEAGKLIFDADNVLTGPFYIDGAEMMPPPACSVRGRVTLADTVSSGSRQRGDL